MKPMLLRAKFIPISDIWCKLDRHSTRWNITICGQYMLVNTGFQVVHDVVKDGACMAGDYCYVRTAEAN